jgi:hypothetical protein
LVAFPDCYERHSALWQPDAILEIIGRLERRGEALQIVCERATTELSLPEVPTPPRRRIDLRLPVSADLWADIDIMQRLDAALRRHEGDDELVVRVSLTTGQERLLRSRSRRVDWGPLLAAEVAGIVGADRVTLHEPNPERMAS